MYGKWNMEQKKANLYLLQEENFPFLLKTENEKGKFVSLVGQR
jgi:hypothetical protein